MSFTAIFTPRRMFWIMPFVLKCAHDAFMYVCTVHLLSLLRHRPADSICDWCKKPLLLEINAYSCVGYEMLRHWTGFINAQNDYINHETTNQKRRPTNYIKNRQEAHFSIPSSLFYISFNVFSVKIFLICMFIIPCYWKSAYLNCGINKDILF